MKQWSEKSMSNSQGIPDNYIKVDRRYRESQYFLMDQLRYSEAVQDFRSVNQAIKTSANFNIGKQTFQFAKLIAD